MSGLRETFRHALGPAAGVAVPAVVLIASAGALGLAFTAQFAFGLEPCPLCLWQRVPYAVLVPIAALALWGPTGATIRAALMAAAAGVFWIGAGLAFYHFGVEQHWWVSPACSGAIPDVRSAAELRAALAQPPPRPCNEVIWAVFGDSITAYNALVSLALGAFALLGALRIRGTARAEP
jgi:disulfide bond formation protein DsbB